ncbi:hypothetical protein [Streptomyces cyaneofuscatus]|uniref:hypothetical protein n=1 Tax=Streptomyces cyaneofuscatus TaxID=66883 RepID=UPI0036DBD2E4
MTELRSTDDVLADMDALLAEIPEQAPAPEPEPTPEPTPEPEPTPAPAPEPAPAAEPEPRGDEWEAITAPRPESNRDRTMRRDGWRPRELPEGLQPDPSTTWPPLAPGPAAPTVPAPTPPIPPMPAAPPTAITIRKVDPQEPAQDDDSPAADQPIPAAPQSTVIATTVSEWRPPPKLGARGWLNLVAYTAAAAGIGVGTGFTQGVYVTLDTLPIGPAAVSGVATAVALTVLYFKRSRATFIFFGVVMVLVLVLQYVSIPVCAGLLASLMTWGLDQRARTMRQPVALAARTLFTAVALATFALTWTTVVPILTGATQ